VIKNDKQNVSVYKKDNNKFVKIEELVGEIKSVPVEDIRTLSVGFKSAESVTALVVNTDLSQELISTAAKKSSNSFRHKLQLYVKGATSYKLGRQRTLGFENMEHYEEVCTYPCPMRCIYTAI
jgi:hypothetical protein